MRVLVLDEWIPYPLISGKRLRSYHLLTRAARNHKITYLCFADPSGEEDARRQIESFGIRLLTLPRRNPFESTHKLCLSALTNLFAPTPLVMKKHSRRDYVVKLRQLVKEEAFDLVHCEWTHYGIYVSELKDHALFLSSHNIEAMPWQRLYVHEKNPAKRAFLYIEWRKMLNFEKEVCARFDHVGAVSEDDRRLFKSSYGCKSVTVIPNGIDVHYYDSVKPNIESKTLVFSASFDAFVNQDAVTYYTRSILPVILDKDPEVKTTFLGKDPPLALQRLVGNRAVFTGTVEDVRPHLSRSSVCIVPVRIAGGSRIKILEAMAAGLPVVSTPEGAEGLEVVPGEHILIARSEEEFARNVIRLLNDRSLADSLSANARRLVEERYDWDRIAPLLERAWDETVSRFKQRLS